MGAGGHNVAIFHNVDQIDHIHAAWNVQAIPRSQFRAQGGINLDGGQSNKNHMNSSKVLGMKKGAVMCWIGPKMRSYTTKHTPDDSSVRRKDGSCCSRRTLFGFMMYLMLLPECFKKEQHTKPTPVLLPTCPFPHILDIPVHRQCYRIAQSMVSADIIGFHAFDHSRHFLNAAKRVMGVVSRTLQGPHCPRSLGQRSCRHYESRQCRAGDLDKP